MIRPLPGLFALGIAAGVPLGCTVSQPQDGTTPVPEATGQVPAEGAAPDSALTSGQYCYSIDSETLTGAVRLTVADNQQVMGDSSFTIHNEEVGYYSAYWQDLTGLLDQNQLALDITTWIEYDVQENEAVWTITPDTLTTENETLTATDCEAVQERFAGPDGQDAAQLMNGLDAADVVTLEFPLGEQAVTHQGELAAGERARFELYQEGGRILDIAVTAPDEAVTFDLIAPSGLVVARAEQSASVLLPHTGWQTIIVDAGDAPAPYELRVSAGQ